MSSEAKLFSDLFSLPFVLKDAGVGTELVNSFVDGCVQANMTSVELDDGLLGQLELNNLGLRR